MVLQVQVCAHVCVHMFYALCMCICAIISNARTYPLTTGYSLLSLHFLGSLEIAVASSPSIHHEILHTYTTRNIDCDIRIIKSKKSPELTIKRLFFSAYSVLIPILRTCFDSIKRSALSAVRQQLVTATAEQVEQAHDLRALFECLEIDKMWNDVCFLDTTIMSLPDEQSKEREAAYGILGKYKSYLDAYTEATSIKEGKSMFISLQRKQSRKKTLKVMKVTVDKDNEDYTCKDCIRLWSLLLIEALEIPEEHIEFCDATPGSTTLTFMVPQTVAEGIREKLSRPAVVWLIKELGILRVQIGVFDMDLREVFQNVPTVSIREGLKSGVDFISLTEVCTYVCV